MLISIKDKNGVTVTSSRKDQVVFVDGCLSYLEPSGELRLLKANTLLKVTFHDIQDNQKSYVLDEAKASTWLDNESDLLKLKVKNKYIRKLLSL
jgi:hypothetical protein